MSAFLVTPEHISEIVKYAKKKEFRYAYNCFTKEQIDCDPKNIVKLLAQANIDSLIARYGDNPKDYADFVNECLNSFLTPGKADLGSGDIYNMLLCWNYQSCEVDNWYETDAYWLHVYLKDWVAKKMATNANVSWSYNNSKVA
jgi:hypothetical protein|tara:strand:- start:60 stop:488 length:429 start_codon:yes stop_codon:yes gene_type:complete